MELRSHPQALLRNALAAAERGWPVFLLGRTKRPVANCPDCRTPGTGHDPQTCDCLTCHGFYAATTDPDRIKAMTTALPRGLLAIRTGTTARLLVVDIDPGHGGHIIPALMPRTRLVATGGGGWHLYYRHPGTPVPSRPLPNHQGIDIKADGGYVVAPPSVHPRTRLPYRLVADHEPIEMPPPLLAACRQQPQVTVNPPTRPYTTRRAGGISSPSALLAAHLDAVRRAPTGNRRTTLYGAARGVARMVAAGAITTADAWTALVDVGRVAEQTDRDIHAAINAAFRAENVATEGKAA